MLALSRDLGVQYKTALVLAHKIMEAMASELKGMEVGGEGKTVETDGGYFGGYIKPANHKENRRYRRLAKNQNGKRRVVVVVRQRGGRTLPAVFRTEFTLQQGTWLSTHTPATGSCPITWWNLQAGPGNTLQGTIGVAGTNRILDVAGTYDSNGIFRLSDQEEGSAAKTGTIDAQVQSNGSLVLRITDIGDPSPCLNRTVYLPWFRNGNNFDPKGGVGGGF